MTDIAKSGSSAKSATRGLTPARRRALDILTRANRPVGAYEMIDLMAAADGKRPAPVSVYRALGYLLDTGLAHRIESRNAFVVCGHAHGHEEPVVFLICEQCGEVKEATSANLARELAALASEAEFSARTRVIEIAGRCARCAAA
ncbi:MAG: transcriptional repressor [Methylocystis sp.]|nr:transcriptional repressor [Methylocystis sp.]